MDQHATSLPRAVTWWVLLSAGLFQAIHLLSCCPVVVQDSRQYILLGLHILETASLDHELFTWRPIGYPLALAGAFKVFGSAGVTVIFVMQHVALVAVAWLTATTMWCLRPSRLLAVVAGLLGGCSVYLSGISNLVLPEAFYCLAVALALFGLARAWVCDNWWGLLIASTGAGMSVLLRASGMALIMLVLVAAVVIVLRRAVGGDGCGPRSRRFHVLQIAACACFPVASLILPAVLTGHRLTGRWRMTSIGDGALYIRAARIDRLDAPDSLALREIKDAIEEAQERGLLPSNANYQNEYATDAALMKVRELTRAEAWRLEERAARDMIRSDPFGVAHRTLRYAARTVLVPDSNYRFLPGGTPGRDGCVARGADAFDAVSLMPLATGLLGPERLKKFVNVDTGPRPLTHTWHGAVRLYRRYVDRGPPLLGVRETFYEEFMVLGLVGMVCAVGQRWRLPWFGMVVVIFVHIGASAFYQGAVSRYFLPVLPAWHCFTALAVTSVVDVLRGTYGLMHGHPQRSTVFVHAADQ